MTGAPIPHAAHPGAHRAIDSEEGTPVAEDRYPHAVSDRASHAASASADHPVNAPAQRVLRTVTDNYDTAASASATGADRSAEDIHGEVVPQPAVSIPVSVWTTAQTSPAAQRKNRYVSESTAHPAKMLPAVATYAIAHYTQPGELVLDPMCGIGTTLVEAVHAGRRAVGVEYEPHWVDVSRANLALAHDAGVAHEGRVFHGDARQIASLLPPQYVGQAALVVTSPPYGPSTHGQVSVAPGAGVQKYHHLYGNTLDRGNLANIGHHRLLSGFTRILAGLVPFLRPGGHIAITIRPWREHAELIDLPSQILACGIHAGLIPVERCVALLARAAEHDLVARGSFFQRDFIRKQREAGLPLHLISHEDVLIFRTGLLRQSSRELRHSQRELGPRPRGRTRHVANPSDGSGVTGRWAA
ncbi:MAG TPA: DNA methyltransferase [Pseudonocardiaceae bacterium]|nr:DNA methyltransferase [Pseudonocardiaceae bacterium]